MAIGQNHTIQPLSENDMAFISDMQIILKDYIAEKMNDRLTEMPHPEKLDEYFQVAWDDHDADDLSEDDIINMFGVAFGQYFVEKAGFEWVIFSDSYGNDLAVHNKQTGSTGFPLSSTAKRLEDETAGTFAGIFHAFTSQ